MKMKKVWKYENNGHKILAGVRKWFSGMGRLFGIMQLLLVSNEFGTYA
jgi:hypothetical protein